MSRQCYDSPTREWVTPEELSARRAKRAAENKKPFTFKAPKRIRRGTYLWRNGKWVHVDDLRRALQRGGGMQIIRDIEPYRAVAADVAAGGKRPVIGGRRQHKEFLKRNGYNELGNEMPKRRIEELPPVRQDLERAFATGMSGEIRDAMARAGRADRATVESAMRASRGSTKH